MVLGVFVGLIVGLVLGYILRTLISKETQSQAESGKGIKALKKEYRDYQDQVSQHLKQTADMISQIQARYGEVQGQIFLAAQELNREESQQNALQPRADFIQYEDGAAKDTKKTAAKASGNQPPRDYAAD